ncbi:hypothetical protein EHS25_009577 [Saitozyma podzolica]|uniref:CAP-Gly domain-containing protein n=1 Tax=Saitozyma podzolica TaxID=1890683 RepID=A0A427YJL3_9TREE|nr:hypothetical protein EHS25_009577 [Saitozyma podzolica]
MVLVSLFVTSPDTHSERRLDTSLTVQALKAGRSFLQFPPSSRADTSLGQAHAHHGHRAAISGVAADSGGVRGRGMEQHQGEITVENTDPNARPGEFSDLSAVEKFELTPEEYASRSDTVLAHLKANKLGRFAPVPTNLTQAPPPPSSAPAEVAPGARCEVISGEGGMAKRGTVRFVGAAEIGKGGVWVGVELDEPTGKGDGSVEGNTYFKCRPLHAVFVRPEKVTIGDFPEEDLMADDDDEI